MNSLAHPAGSKRRHSARLAILASLAVVVAIVLVLRACSTDESRISTASELQPPGPMVEPGNPPTVATPTAKQTSDRLGTRLPSVSVGEGNSQQSPIERSADGGRVNWSLVREHYPIPREMPAGQSDDPHEAGFAREWLERSLGSRTAFLQRFDGTPFMDPKPLILDIMSEPKNPEDSWSYGVEYELRRVVEQQSRQRPEPAVTRVFCNLHGCLVYLEFEGEKMSSISSIPNAILKSSWRKEFGIEGRNVFLVIGRQEEPRIRWQLFLIHRHPPK